MKPKDHFEQRKIDHIKHCLDDQVDVLNNKFSCIKLIHESLPDLNFNELDIATPYLGHKFSSPIFISSMTAGHEEGQKLNQTFASVCHKKNWLFNVGSQRKQLSDEVSQSEWLTLKEAYPEVKMCANLGVAQIITHSVIQIEALINSIDALALIIHLNPLQEVIQYEGTPQFKGGLAKIKQLSAELKVPVIIKETGCGFSKDTLLRLIDSGIYCVDISGFGGTHWGRVEGLRAKQSGHHVLSEVAKTYAHWGESTVDCLMAIQHLNLPYKIWASGGVRNGLEVAKCLAMGAEAVGLARPFLQKAVLGEEQLLQFMDQLEVELKVALFCTGSADVSELKGKWKWISNS